MEEMVHAFQAGGWMMWPIVALGVTTVAVAVRFAVSDGGSRLSLVRALSACTVLCGAFGTIIGWMRVLAFAGVHFADRPLQVPEESDATQRFMILAEGGREALTCIATSLLFAALGALLVAWGLQRRQESDPPVLARSA